MKKMLIKAKSALERISLATGTALLFAGTAMAQNVAPIDVGGGRVNRINIYGGSLETLITTIVNVILIVVGVIAVLYLIYGGITYVTAGGDAEKAGKGRTTITNAIIGIIIIAASLAIYNFVVRQIGE